MPSATRGERASALRPAGIAIATFLTVGVAAPAQAAPTLTGDLLGHYSNVDEYQNVAQPDGTFRRVRTSTSFWSQEYRLSYSRVLPMRTSLVTELRYADVTRVGATQRTITPYGLVRLTAPVFGVTAAYRPVQSLFESGAPANDTLTLGQRQRLLSKDSDLQLSAYVTPGALPRFDGQFVQRHHTASVTGASTTSTLRSVRAAKDLRRLQLQAGYTDQVQQHDGIRVTTNRSYTAGVDWNVLQSVRRTMQLGYTFLRGETPGGFGRIKSDNHNLTTNVGWRLSDRSSVAAGGYYHRAVLYLSRGVVNEDYDLFATHSARWTNVLSSSAGGGLHTFQDRGSVRRSPYASASLTLEGTPRPKWRGSAGLTHATNWLSGNGPASTDAFTVTSVFDVSRSFEARASADAGYRSGTLILAPQRLSSNASAGMRLQPLRSLSFNVDASRQAYGGSLLHPDSRADAGSFGVFWQPVRTLSLNGSRAVSGSFPDNRYRTYSSSVSGTFRLTRALQFDGNYSNSHNSAPAGTVASLRSESYGFRFTGLLTRRLSGNIGFQDSQHGQPNEVRYFDMTATYRFSL